MAEIRALEIKSSSEWGFNEKKTGEDVCLGTFQRDSDKN